MRAWFIGCIAAALVGLTILGPAVGIGDAERAHAICTSSINPTCQPANIPILVEAGVIATNAAPSTPNTIGGKTPKVPKRAGGGWLGMIFNGIGALGGFLFSQGYQDPDTGEKVNGKPVITDRGLVDQTVEVPASPSAVVSADMLNENGVWNAEVPNTINSQVVDSVRLKYEYQVTGRTMKRLVTQVKGTPQDNWSDWEMIMMCRSPNNSFEMVATGSQPRYDFTDSKPDFLELDCPAAHPEPWVAAARTFISDTWPGYAAPYKEDIQLFGPGGVWFAPNHPVRTAQATGTMERELRCIDPNMVVKILRDATPVALGSKATLPDLVCPDGTTPVDVSSTWKPDTGNPVPVIKPGEVNPPPIPSEYKNNPNCLAGGCVLELKRDNQTCGAVGELCLDWAQDWVTNPMRYRCEYGGAPVAIEMCSAYRSPKHGVLPNMTATGTLLPPTAALPPSLPNTTTTDPKPDPEGPGLPELPDPDECWDDGWAEAQNPLDWVLVPVKCALVWAFVPRAEVVESAMRGATSKWDKTMPGRIPSIVATTFATPTLTGCEGLHVNIPLSGLAPGWVDINFRAFDACSGPPAQVAALAKAIGAAILIFATALGIIRRASATVNAPGVGGGGA